MLIRLNDRGVAVKTIQQMLGITADGHFGPATLTAVQNFQRSVGLVPDGIVGPGTLAALQAKPTRVNVLTQADYVRAGEILKCHPGMVEAIALKETRGQPFLSDGRPAILFERHIFYKRMNVVRKAGVTQAQQSALRNAAFAQSPDICNPVSGGYKGGLAEHARLERAIKYSETAALESASWGQFQVMGFNAVAIGYSSVQEFVTLMGKDVQEHLLSLVRFILSTPQALRGIREQDFPKLAAAYNGPAYAKNNYDKDLSKLFNQVKGKYDGVVSVSRI